MAWDEKGTAKEVESLKKRYPKKGIDPTIPEGVRATLREMEQDKMTPASKYARGGGIESRGKTKGKMVKMAMGGMAATSLPVGGKPQISEPFRPPVGGGGGVPQISDPLRPPVGGRPDPRFPPGGQRSPSGGMPPGPGGIPGKFDQPARPQISDPLRPPVGGRVPAVPSGGRPQISDPLRPPVPSKKQPYKRDWNARAGTYADGGSVGSASNRADGCAQRGKTKCKYI